MSNVNIYQNYRDSQLTECTEFTSNNNNLRATYNKALFQPLQGLSQLSHRDFLLEQ